MVLLHLFIKNLVCFPHKTVTINVEKMTRVRLATLSTILLDNLNCISKLTEQLSLIFTFYATIIKFAS
ncbi:hypothetical protein EB796_006825 [Bugula neritina]|uniref:Uncharacterized protein n=1 Tax=Bugula neritina TaxID=10212 RepID=A0A7J7K9K1_BUGNE|nr:hypothetical protein EB796_006825 [Bugula neritina]